MVTEFGGRISLFDENGDFVEQLAVGARRPSYRIDAETFLYVYRQDPIPNPPGQLRLTQTIVVGTQQGPGSDTLAVLLGDEFVVAPGGRSSVQLPLTVDTYHVIDMSGRLVATTGDHTLAFYAIGRGDDIEARIERNPPAISDAEWKRAVEEMLLRTEDLSGRAPPEFVAARSRSVREMLSAAQKPASLPGFDRLVASRDGGVWAREYKLDPERTGFHEWFIFGEDGRWITSVHIPARLTLQEVSSEHILAVAEDELGVQRIELYPIISNAVD